MHHAALCFDAEFECGGDKALEQGMSAVGAALELGVELCAEVEVTARQLHGLHKAAIGAGAGDDQTGAKAGASVPLLGFGNVLWKGVKEAVVPNTRDLPFSMDRSYAARARSASKKSMYASWSRASASGWNCTPKVKSLAWYSRASITSSGP